MSAADQLPQTKTHPAFSLLRSQRLETLNLTVNEFEHRVTGARHYHLDAPNRENVFMVAFRTVPMNSTGVAHMLEHTVLCGSEKFPVRDPFFLMIRRSLNTFMNAFTSSDYTAYPFASQNAQDFDNLLEIYLDAVFFSRLDPLDFAQEGHRLEFVEPNNTASALTYKGIVYNEMKGDVSSPISVLYDTLKKHLFPTTTYHFNSGGDPKCIPDLTYDDLMDFYRSHYHPSNAMFMTYGDRSAFELQQAFEEQALSRFDSSSLKIEAGLEDRFQQPKRVMEYYAVEGDASSESELDGDKARAKSSCHGLVTRTEHRVGPIAQMSLVVRCSVRHKCVASAFSAGNYWSCICRISSLWA